MATLVLSVIGGSLFTAGSTAALIGAGVGAAVGGFIDQQIFGPSPPDAPRIDGFRLQSASEGSPVRYCLGPKNRVAGTLIFATALNSVEIDL